MHAVDESHEMLVDAVAEEALHVFAGARDSIPAHFATARSTAQLRRDGDFHTVRPSDHFDPKDPT